MALRVVAGPPGQDQGTKEQMNHTLIDTALPAGGANEQTTRPDERVSAQSLLKGYEGKSEEPKAAGCKQQHRRPVRRPEPARRLMQGGLGERCTVAKAGASQPGAHGAQQDAHNKDRTAVKTGEGSCKLAAATGRRTGAHDARALSAAVVLAEHREACAMAGAIGTCRCARDGS